MESLDTGATLREWSSLIGIVTAIIGNVLISFALNVQRYAHIRLDRQKEHHEGQKDDGHLECHPPSYGTYQNRLAEERAEINRTASIASDASALHRIETSRNSPSKLVNIQHDRDHDHGRDHDTTSPERNSRRSSESEATIRPVSPPSRKARQSSLSASSDSSRSSPSYGRTYLQSPYWWGGIVLMTIGETGNFLAYGFAPASIVSPLGVVALVSNCVIAPLLLKERFRQRDFWGVVVAIAGAVTVVLSAKTSEEKMGPDDIWSAITRLAFEVYLGITVFLITILIYTSEGYGDRFILVDLGLVGLFGGYTALATKGIASLLSFTLWRALTFPITYLLIFVLVFTALMQIRYVNRALQRFDSTQVIPVQFVLFTISVIIGSAILYRDFESATAAQMAKFVGGCFLTFAGVYLITSRRTGPSSSADAEKPYSNAGHGIKMIDEEQAAMQQPEDTIQEESEEEEGTDDDGAGAVASNNRVDQESGTMLSATNKRRLPRSSFSNRSHASSTQTSSRKSSLHQARPNMSVHLTSPSRPSAPTTSASTPLLPSGSRIVPSRAQSNTPASSRPSTLSRRSMAMLRPGPLMAPLSSSLSAVIAEERRRAESNRLTPSNTLKSQRSSSSMRAAGVHEGQSVSIPRSQSPRSVPQDPSLAESSNDSTDPRSLTDHQPSNANASMPSMPSTRKLLDSLRNLFPAGVGKD